MALTHYKPRKSFRNIEKFQRKARYLEETFLMKKNLHFHRENNHLIPRTLIDARKTHLWNTYVTSEEKRIRSWGPFMWLLIKYADCLVLMASIYSFVMETIFEHILHDPLLMLSFAILRKCRPRIFLYLGISIYSLFCTKPSYSFRPHNIIVWQVRAPFYR